MRQDEYQTMTERELLGRSQSDERTYSEIISRHLGTVRRLAGIYSKGGFDYDDLFSEGLMGLMNAVKTYDESKGASFSTYSYSCISNRMMNSVKRSTRIKSSEEPMDDELEITSGQSPESILMSSEGEAEIWELAESRLSELERNVLESYLEGKSHAETAEELGITPKSVDNALQRIRRKFRS